MLAPIVSLVFFGGLEVGYINTYHNFFLAFAGTLITVYAIAGDITIVVMLIHNKKNYGSWTAFEFIWE
jgi:hypothetical protein